MHITERLLDSSFRDSELIKNLESQGTIINRIHTLDYCFITSSKEQAEIVCSFISDNAYGNARIKPSDESYRVIVEIQTPLIHHIVYNISANMVSISYMFKVDYVGWGTCVEAS